jgi:hypothetical protein
MLNDDAELDAELNWDSKNEFEGPNRRHWKWWRAPKGSHAILVFALFYAIPIGFMAIGSFQRSVPSGILGLFAWMGLTLLVLAIATFLARATWRLMGPVGRTLIRPLMILGPIPPFLLGCMACCMLPGLVQVLMNPTPPKAQSQAPAAPSVQSQAAPATPPSAQSQAPTPVNVQDSEPNWSVPRPGASATGWREAQKLCSKKGPQWRLPREDEAEKLHPLPPVKKGSAATNYWLLPEEAPPKKPAPSVMMRVACQGPSCSHEVQHLPPTQKGKGRKQRAAVVCVDF